MAIKSGTIVWLKSGSPAMTVKVKHTATNRWVCSWFVGTSVQEASFAEEQLTETEPEKSGANKG